MKTVFRKSSWVGAIAALLFVAATANADTIVFNNITPDGTQLNYALGMDFVVNNAVTVTALGAFDDVPLGFFNPIQVGIFRVSDGLLMGTSATFDNATPGTLFGVSRFKAVIPFLLIPDTYSIVAVGYTNTGAGTDYSGNTGLGAPPGATTFNGGTDLTLVPKGGRWNDPGNLLFVLPTQNNFGTYAYPQPDPVFQAGTFAIDGPGPDLFAVPDGGSASMMLGAGVLALAWVRRRLM